MLSPWPRFVGRGVEAPNEAWARLSPGMPRPPESVRVGGGRGSSQLAGCCVPGILLFSTLEFLLGGPPHERFTNSPVSGFFASPHCCCRWPAARTATLTTPGPAPRAGRPPGAPAAATSRSLRSFPMEATTARRSRWRWPPMTALASRTSGGSTARMAPTTAPSGRSRTRPTTRSSTSKSSTGRRPLRPWSRSCRTRSG